MIVVRQCWSLFCILVWIEGVHITQIYAETNWFFYFNLSWSQRYCLISFSQALLAAGYSQGNYEQARQVVFRLLQVFNIPNYYICFSCKLVSCHLTDSVSYYFILIGKQIGLVTGISLAALLFLGFGPFSHLFSTDSEVLAIAWSGLLVSDLHSTHFSTVATSFFILPIHFPL